MQKEPSSPFQHSTLEEAKLSQEKIDKLAKHFNDYDIETCMIYKSNALVYTYEKTDNLSKEPHKINSVTKSVLSSLIGIALQEEYLSSIDEPITKFLASTEDYETQVDHLTIRHLLTMTSGLDPAKWNQAIESTHVIDDILTESFQTEPGEKMVYNNSDSHILSAILEKTSGMNAAKFAEKYLFNSLEISDYKWEKDENDLSIGGYGLYLTPVDLMKYAVLILQEGEWQGEQLISKSWIQEATEAHVSTDRSNQSYGYHWWVSEPLNDLQPRFYYAAGRGGKFIFVEPNQQLAVTVTARLSSKDSLLPYQWFVRYILDKD